MNFGILSAQNSYPQLEVSCGVEWRSLNYDFRYDVILAHLIVTSNSYPQVEVSCDVEWRSMDYAFSCDVREVVKVERKMSMILWVHSP